MKIFLNIVTFCIITITYLFSSGCGNGCNCSQTKIKIVYQGANFQGCSPNCTTQFVTAQSLVFTNDVKGSVFAHSKSTGNFPNTTYNFDNGCNLLFSEMRFMGVIQFKCMDIDGSLSQQTYSCADEFDVTPPKCGETKTVYRKYNCNCFY